MPRRNLVLAGRLDLTDGNKKIMDLAKQPGERRESAMKLRVGDREGRAGLHVIMCGWHVLLSHMSSPLTPRY